MFYVGFILYFFILCTVILTIPNAFNLSRIAVFIHPMSFFIVIGSIVSVTIATGNFKDVVLGFRSLSGKNHVLSEEELKRVLSVFDMLFNVAIVSGFIGLLIGIVNMLAELRTLYATGPYVQFSLMSILYGLILAFFIFLPARIKLQTSIKV